MQWALFLTGSAPLSVPLWNLSLGGPHLSLLTASTMPHGHPHGWDVRSPSVCRRPALQPLQGHQL